MSQSRARSGSPWTSTDVQSFRSAAELLRSVRDPARAQHRTRLQQAIQSRRTPPTRCLHRRQNTSRPKVQPSIALIVCPTPQAQIRNRILSPHSCWLDMIELQTSPRATPPAIRRDVSALLPITQKDRPRHRRGVPTPRLRSQGWLRRGRGHSRGHSRGQRRFYLSLTASLLPHRKAFLLQFLPRRVSRSLVFVLPHPNRVSRRFLSFVKRR
jgi:hypothetical protein